MLKYRSAKTGNPKQARAMARYITARAVAAAEIRAEGPQFDDLYHLYAQMVVNGAAARDAVEEWMVQEHLAEEMTGIGRLAPLPEETGRREQSFGWLIAEGYLSADGAARLWDESTGRKIHDRLWEDALALEQERMARHAERVRDHIRSARDAGHPVDPDDQWNEMASEASRRTEAIRADIRACVDAEGREFDSRVREWTARYDARNDAIRAAAETVIRQKFADAVADQERAARPLSPAQPRQDIDPGLAARLKIDPRRNLSVDELAHLMSGRRADGGEIFGVHKKETTFHDFVLTPDKSISVAFGLAEGTERDVLVQLHREAVDAAMRHLVGQIGWARRGRNGEDGAEPGHVAWARVEHASSRPTLDTVNEEGVTERVPLALGADPNLHSHVIVFNHVLTASGHLGSLDTMRIRGNDAVARQYYHATLATKLRQRGAEVEVDPRTGAARLVAVPDPVREHFSRRRRTAEEIARQCAARNGKDWEQLPDKERHALVYKASLASRHPKGVEQEDRASWQQRAADLGWQYRPVLNAEVPRAPLPPAERHAVACETALWFLEREFARSAVLEASRLKVAAATGLIASGTDGPGDIDAVVDLMLHRGVRHEGVPTPLVAGPDGEYYTTERHIGTEQAVVELAARAAADTSAALKPEAIEREIARLGLRFEKEHGRQQHALVHALGESGRLSVGIGVAGSGKTTILKPLVAAWKAEGRRVYGTALARRHATALGDAGIEGRFSLAKLFQKADEPQERSWSMRGGFRLDKDAVVVVDELSLIGASDMALLLRLQERTGCQLVMIGDPLQCASPEASPTIDLLRRAIPDMPKVLLTIRQQAEEEQKTVALFRNGNALDALKRKQADGTLHLVPGGYERAVARIADLWAQRRRAGVQDITISAPTNEDARAIAHEIRKRRRQAGEIGPDLKVVKATDPDGAKYDLALAKGDRLRLYKAARALFDDDTRGPIGVNGDIVTVVDLGSRGIRLRNASGAEGIVFWNRLRADDSDRVLLTYGDALTIHLSQGITSDEHIAAFPAGTRTIDRNRTYVAASRHRQVNWIVTSEGEERANMRSLRPIGDQREITAEDVVKHMAAHMARRETRLSALRLLEALKEARAQQAPVPAELPHAVAAREAVHLRQTEPLVQQALRRLDAWREGMDDRDHKGPAPEERRGEAPEKPSPAADVAAEAAAEMLRARITQGVAAPPPPVRHRAPRL